MLDFDISKRTLVSIKAQNNLYSEQPLIMTIALPNELLLKLFNCILHSNNDGNRFVLSNFF